MFLRWRVEARCAKELTKEDLAEYVAASLYEFGFPEDGYTRYVFLMRGILFQTDDLKEYDRIDIGELAELVYRIRSWEDFVRQYKVKIHKRMTEGEKINIYIKKTIYETNLYKD